MVPNVQLFFCYKKLCMKLAILGLLLADLLTISYCQLPSVVKLSGGAVPQANDATGEYFEKFRKDYGSNDTWRHAGFIQGLIPSGKLRFFRESDGFMEWWNDYLENGPTPITGRIKPYYAIDFGTKQDLKNGENPKIIILKNMLPRELKDASRILNKDDVEVRTIWHPWLKWRCNFAVRYVVPNRINIIRLLESHGRVKGQISVNRNASGRHAVVASLIFYPNWLRRLLGRKPLTLRRSIDGDILTPAQAAPSITPDSFINDDMNRLAKLRLGQRR